MVREMKNIEYQLSTHEKSGVMKLNMEWEIRLAENVIYPNRLGFSSPGQMILMFSKNSADPS